MDDLGSRPRAFFGLGWTNLRANRTAVSEGGQTRASVARYDEHQIMARWLRRGTSSDIVSHGETDAWLHVVSGALVEERWTAGDEGWSFEVRHLRTGDSSHLPKGALHRLAAGTDASIVMTYSPGPPVEKRVTHPTLVGQLARARERVLGTSIFRNTAVELHAPSEDDC
ncbi:MAG: hypothetical protein U0234_13775 [Sandaracinus sp.]